MDEKTEKNEIKDINLDSNLEIDQNKKFGLNIFNEGKDNKTIWLSFIVFVTALIILGFFIFKYSERYEVSQKTGDSYQEQNKEELLEIKRKLPTEMKGKIFLTLTPKNDQNNTVGIYIYDLKKEKLEEFLVNEGEQLTGGEVGHFNEEDYISVTDQNSIFLNSIESLNSNNRLNLLDDNIKNRKSAPVWSNEDKYVIYNVQENSSLDSNIPENWQIYLLQTGTEKNEGKYLTNGIYPHISKDNNIIFLKNDGVYVIDLEGKKEIKTWNIKGEVESNIQLDVSHTGDIEILSNPNEKSLFILRNKRENYAFEGEILKELKVYASYPTLSPNDKFLAILEVEKKEDGVLINPKLVVYNLVTYEKYEIMDLNNYKLEHILISDWI